MSAIITLTLNPALDKTCSVQQVSPEQKLRCRDVAYHPGGGGINVARAATRLGVDALAVWTQGGALGRLLRDHIDAEQLQHNPVPVAAMTRENLIAFEESSGQQFRFGMPGARLTNEEVEKCIEVLNHAVRRHASSGENGQQSSEDGQNASNEHADGSRLASHNRPEHGQAGTPGDGAMPYVVLSGSLPPGCDADQYGQIIAALPSECRIVLDTSGRPLAEGIKNGVYLIKPNKRELGQLGGRPIEDDVQIRNVARRLIDDGNVEVVVTSLGSGGAVLTTSDTHETIRAPTVEIRSKVGAGDSMVAGIVVALAQKQSLLNAARFGVAAGSAAVMTEGTELCHRSDTELLFAERLNSQQ